jgi:L-methionine (R)-S-oxide reductase
MLNTMNTNKKQGRYLRLYRQAEGLLIKCENPISRMSTISALLHNKMEYFFWTGFYLLNNNKLQVGPYQGALACMELKQNQGVCWAGINNKETIIVPDVHQFPGHIACDSRSKSEIVVPIKNSTGEIIGVLDIDSKDLNSFDETDAQELEKFVNLIYNVN